MSLEQSINELTIAVRELTMTMRVQEKPEAIQPLPGAAKKSKAVDTASTPKSGKPSAPTPEKSSDATKNDAAPVDYDTVKAAILAISGESREKAVALLSRYGAKSGKDLTAEQYDTFYADAQRVLAGEYDPEEGE